MPAARSEAHSPAKRRRLLAKRVRPRATESAHLAVQLELLQRDADQLTVS